jgi:hypothetical protein
MDIPVKENIASVGPVSTIEKGHEPKPVPL